MNSQNAVITIVINLLILTLTLKIKQAMWRAPQDCRSRRHKHVRAEKKERAAEFMRIWCDPSINAIIPPWRRELLIEILPLLDFNRIADTQSKWFMGYSDISTLLFLLTLMTDIATIHGCNFMDYIALQTDKFKDHAHGILTLDHGTTFNQESSSHYQSKWTDLAKEPGCSIWKVCRPRCN